MSQPESVSLQSIEEPDLPSEKMRKLTLRHPNPNCHHFLSVKSNRLSPGEKKYQQIQAITSQLKLKTQSPQDVDITKVRLMQTIRSSDGKEEDRQVRGVKLREFSGCAVLLLPNGRRISSKWVKGQPIGYTRIFYPAGFEYRGPLLDYKRHGKGELRFSNGHCYIGEFDQGDIKGYGILYDKGGNVVFKGEWDNNEPIEE